MQTKDDGKHTILPVAARIMCEADHTGMPVTMPRDSDGKMRRDGSRAAVKQRHCAVDARKSPRRTKTLKGRKASYCNARQSILS